MTATMKINMKLPQKTQSRTIMWPCYIIPKDSKSAYLHIHIYWSNMNNNQDMISA